ncbi:MAG: YidB family protein [Sulfurovum sp.]
MDLMDLFKTGASMIQGNSDDITTGLDIEDISKALSSIMGDGKGGINLASFVSGLSSNGLGEIVGSWLGNGDNKSIDIEQITSLFGSDKIAEFASALGLSEDSAKSALAESVPNIVDEATRGETTIMDTMLSQVGSGKGAMDMIGKMFR